MSAITTVSTRPDAGPLRVAVLTRAVYPLHGYGGLERHVYDLVRHLARDGMRIHLITQPPNSTASRATGAETNPAFAFGLNVATRFVPYRTFPMAGRRGTTVLDRSTAYLLFGEHAGRVAANLAERGDVDVVYGLGASALGYARWLRRRGRKAAAPFVFNPQGLEEFGATDPRRARLKRIAYLPLQKAVRYCAQAADVVIATDRALEPTVLRHLDVPRERVRVIANGIDVAECDGRGDGRPAAEIRASVGAGPRDAVLLSVGRLEANKGFHVLADALASLPARVRPWRWILVGDGPYRTRVQHQVADARLSDRVTFTGRVTDEELHALYRAADLFVHPTLYEGSSLVTLEAMTHRVPVIATDAGGLPDKVRPGHNGWLVPPGDRGALASALDRALCANDAELARMGRESRAIVEAQFAWTVIAAELRALFRELMGGPTH